MLGWLMNMDFAAGEVGAAPEAPAAEADRLVRPGDEFTSNSFVRSYQDLLSDPSLRRYISIIFIFLGVDFYA
jgi:hypothetical protein